MNKNDIGIVGLAVMGRSLALNMADHGFQVAGYNRSYQVSQHMLVTWPHENFHAYETLPQFIGSLKSPRKIMLMVKAGETVDLVMNQLLPLLDQGDIILDGGNSYFQDTIRREQNLKEKGIHFFGVGVSGGEDGARFGPSIMPGGNQALYEEIRPLLEAIAARAEDGTPCCSYIGENGAGHYVKMVHNGIEYADMQIISEAYLLLKQGAGLSNTQLADIFKEFNEGELNSFLIEITADILREKDPYQKGELLDQIKDSAKQKGTGKWTSEEAIRQGVDVSMISASYNARMMSGNENRSAAQQRFPFSERADVKDVEAFIQQVKEGMYAAKIIAYSQGFDLMKKAAETYGWNLSFAKIASIFRAGCIIRARFLNEITRAYQEEDKLSHLLLDEFFAQRISTYSQSLRQISAYAILHAIPAPSLNNAISYLDMLSAPLAGANLIQAQRDYFGAHTFERKDKEGSFHHEWGDSHA